MQGVKGLEFDRVIVAGVNEGVVPFKQPVSGSAGDSPLQRFPLFHFASRREHFCFLGCLC
jgi:superfamily I DNA/RNA helicase